jgi:hypothetical protein
MLLNRSNRHARHDGQKTSCIGNHMQQRSCDVGECLRFDRQHHHIIRRFGDVFEIGHAKNRRRKSGARIKSGYIVICAPGVRHRAAHPTATDKKDFHSGNSIARGGAGN